tara:strand:+ start:681 stop:1169 length:489 start_codon:yes stop_codon:yes gene_type:complete
MENKNLKTLIERLVSESPVLKEQVSDDPNSFTTEITDVNFSGLDMYFPEYKGRDMDISYLNCSVNWRYEIDLRSWGIKDITFYTSSVSINAFVEIYDEDYTKVEVEKEIELFVDNMGGFSSDKPDTWHYVDLVDDEMRYGQSIFPVELDIDVEDMTVNVIWN